MHGSRVQEAAAGRPGAAGARIRKEKMDYLMIIVPLKLALVVYIAYVLFH
jgi:hypothetical protein